MSTSVPSPRRGRTRLVAGAAVGLVVLVAVVLMWQRRWMSDDGAINLRVVAQLKAGNGPVFNAGERVEAATSTVWIALLLVGDVLLPVALEWVAVLLGIALSAAGLVLAAAGARALWSGGRGDSSEQAVLPFGIAVFALVPMAWDYASSGLEGGLILAWLGGVFLVCSRAASTDLRSQPRRWLLAGAMVIGLGPLVRPDLGLYTAGALAAYAWWVPGWRRRLAVLAAAAALPALYELFRMGYYGLLVPNTALAKEASEAWWSQGLAYIAAFVRGSRLWVPALAGAAALVWVVARLVLTGRRRAAALALVFVGCAGLHTAYVGWVGGDWMYGRMLLPPLFAALAPLAMVPVRRALLAPVVVGVAWAAVMTAPTGPYDDSPLIVDVRAVQNPTGAVTVDDVRWSGVVQWGQRARADAAAAAAEGGAVWVVYPSPYHDPVFEASHRHQGGTSMASISAIGFAGYVAGVDVYVDDTLGLANPVGSHLRLGDRAAAPRNPGHEKTLPLAWTAARFLPPDEAAPAAVDPAAVADARAALRCGDVRRSIEATRAPLTVGRFVRNLLGAASLTRARWDPQPAAARAEACS